MRRDGLSPPVRIASLKSLRGSGLCEDPATRGNVIKVSSGQVIFQKGAGPEESLRAVRAGHISPR